MPAVRTGPTQPRGSGRPCRIASVTTRHRCRAIVAARRDGDEFGLDRLVDFIGRQLASGHPAPETMRRLIHQILEHQKDALQDDASAVLVEWSQQAARRVDL